MSDDTTKKERLWLLPESDRGVLPAGLYLVATPIGNLRDISIRALDTLAAVDLIACEDTRVSKKLFSYYGLKKDLLSYNDHSSEEQRAKILSAVAGGKAVALVSDAGTPLVSDPGYKLVRAALEQGVSVTAIPGANAPLSALQLSGLPSDKFSFIGFLPPKAGAREKMLREWRGGPGTLIAFETAPRLLDTLGSIHAVLGDRNVAVVREITKLYEESRRASVAELITHYKAKGPPKGEIVLVIGPGEVSFDDADIDAQLREALKNMSTKDAAAFVAEITGRPKKDLYQRALDISKND
ncbi:MAG: 16S rRNA (cytidine(1402)-2'-O)-methyltransferase [Alphaproteobacteria bacterium]|nr:16S rRNA (cytidine(1402)-2'-O)-methyltransferase [Alphaproteobacteria bacterium]